MGRPPSGSTLCLIQGNQFRFDFKQSALKTPAQFRRDSFHLQNVQQSRPTMVQRLKLIPQCCISHELAPSSRMATAVDRDTSEAMVQVRAIVLNF
jgi:hypothetical protein